MSVRLLSVVVLTACAIAAATACSAPPSTLDEGDIKKATQASSVTVQMFDKSGAALGSCSGTLVSKDLVLTAGHCAAGVATWKIANADVKSTAKRAVTPWKAFGSNLAHPDHSDLALLVLSSPITLDRYPAIATSPLSSGTRALHFQRTSASAASQTPASIDIRRGRASGFRLNYTAKPAAGAFLDTGGAVIDPSTGKIVGVTSAKGTTSGLLHIARTDNFAKWISQAITCGESGPETLSPRGYPGSSSSGGDWGGYGGGGGNKLDAAPPPPYGGDGGASSSGSSGTSGSSGSNDGGTSGSTPGDGTDNPGGEGGTSTCPGTPTCEGDDCPGKNGPGTPGSMTPGGGGGGGDGTGDDTPGDDTPGSNGGNSPGSVPDASSDDVCPGPPGCPEPDSQRCSGPTCGGCAGIASCGDATMDYGDCASCGSDAANGKPPVLR